jgi:Xaa-Pro aminopeptidase
MSRNIVAGTPSDEVRRLLEACLEAEEVGLRETRPGMTVSSLLNAMKRVIDEHGFAEWDWTTGHGAGMDILEEPFFGPDSQVLLEPGMTFYIEPMIVPTHIGTICIEDIVLVTETGCEELTTSEKRTW